MRPILPFVLLLVACNSDDTNITKYTEAPVVSITTPADGATFAETTPLTFVAEVTDDEDALDEMVYAWTKQDGAALIGDQEILEGEVRFTVPDGLGDGDYTIQLKVTDSTYQDASDTVTISVVDNSAPTAEFLEPLDGAVLSDLDLIDVDVLCADAEEDDLNALALSWSGDLVDGAPANPTSDGHARYSIDPQEPGTYTISVTVTDSIGSDTQAQVRFDVLASDADGDGYVTTELGGDDCDDDDATIHPNAEELCDDVDRDCDGDTTAGATDGTTRWLDADGDGYGDPAHELTSCEDPGGYVEDARDCDDSDATEHPEADEICDGDDDDCDGDIDEDDALDANVWHADRDVDGFGSLTDTTVACQAPEGYTDDDTDCDDSDPGVLPGGTESCNDIDDDCDGAVDEDALDAGTWYTDGDADSYGDAASWVLSCVAPAGTVADATDCDDADTLSSPAGTEVCDSRDNDCDGTVDEGTDASDARTWYLDGDADGYGTDTTTRACAEPAGYAGMDGDCDDGDATISPAATEVCNGADDDCDGTTDEADAIDASTWYADGDGDSFGDAGTTTVACDAPIGFVADDQDCDDATPLVNPDRAEVCNGVDDDCDGTVDVGAEDALSGWTDGDHDGYGSPTGAVSGCTLPAGSVANDEDCDDTRASISPVGTEVCDSLDDDCDGAVDEADATDAGTWYVDTDADTHGDASVSTRACAAPSGFVASADDCDDTDATVSPTADERCDGVDDDCDAEIDEDSAVDALDWYADADGDTYGTSVTHVHQCYAPSGYVGNDDDCNDFVDSAYPGAPETCNGEDDDCDGVEDDGAIDVSTWYRDADGDGYGTSATWTTACEAPSGYVGNDDDCDDTSAAISPADAEVCDTKDNDCDGLVDEADATDAGTWYADSDGDGYGSTTSTTHACSMPSGYLATGTDCDDAASSVHPGATESCGTTADDDCDGSTNEVDASGCTTFYADADGDSYGATTSVCQCAATTSYPASAGGDCDDANNHRYPDAPETCSNGADEDCDGFDALCPIDGSVDASEFNVKYLGTSTSEQAGFDLAFVPDMNGDGKDDLALGAAVKTSNTGTVYVEYGGATGSTSLSGATTWITGTTTADYFGFAADGGDFDGDGVGDMLISGYAGDEGGSNAGAAWLVFGMPTTGVWVVNSYDDYGWYGSTTTDYFGKDVAAIDDIDGDGCDEVAIGAELQDSGGASAGAVYLQFGCYTTTSSHRSANTMDVKIVGEDSSDEMGSSIADAGDFDGDGVHDLAITAFGDDTVASGAGAFYVATELYAMGSSVDASALDYKYAGDSSGDSWGYGINAHPLSSAGDTDHDGYSDMLIGCYADDGAADNAGAIYVVTGGGSPGTYAMSAMAFKITGEGASDNFGYSLTGGSDIDGDGFDDFAVGSPYDDDSASNAGAAYLYYGNSAAAWTDYDAKIYGEDTSDYFGYTVQMGGDINGDGFGDLLVGAIYDDDGASNAGAIYGFFGGPR